VHAACLSRVLNEQRYVHVVAAALPGPLAGRGCCYGRQAQRRATRSGAAACSPRVSRAMPSCLDAVCAAQVVHVYAE
jgi:hypothetical protein